MRSGRRGPGTSSIHAGVRRVIAVAVAVGVFAWAVLPAFSFPLDSDTGSTTCRMACADTAECCCKPASAQPSKNDRSSGTEMSTPATTESCPRDCATLTVVPGISTVRSANAAHRLGAPDAEHTSHLIETLDAARQELLDVAQPRGPPAPRRNGLSIARVSPNTSGVRASRLVEFPRTIGAGSGSSESMHSSVRWSTHPSSIVLEPRDSSLSTELASRRGQEPAGVDAHQHGGTHE